jgi:hypothetical protein
MQTQQISSTFLHNTTALLRMHKNAAQHMRIRTRLQAPVALWVAEHEVVHGRQRCKLWVRSQRLHADASHMDVGEHST